MKNEAFVKDWLKHAKSNLERAKAGQPNEDVLLEDLCFDCQQCVEKSLKALLVSLDKEFPLTHSIARLIELIVETGIEMSDGMQDAIILTDYAVKTRYPGEFESLSQYDYEEALDIAQKTYQWVLGQLHL